MDSAQPPTRPKLGLKLAFGFGSLATASWAVMGGLVLFFYNQVIGVPAHLVSFALGIGIFFDALWDPIIGQASDRVRSKWGRRHPFLYVAVLLVPLAFFLRWNPPAWPHEVLFFYVLATGMFMNFAASLFDVPAGALAPELAPNYHDRTVLMSYRWFFLAFGGVLGSVLTYGVFLRATPEHPVGQLNPDGYGPLAFTISAIAMVSMLVFATGTHHRVKHLHVPAETAPKFAEQLRDVIETLKNWNFGVAVSASAIAGIGAGLTSGLTLYFNTYFWELSSADILLLTLMAAPAAPIAALVAPILGKRWGKKRSCMTVFFASTLLSTLPMLLRLTGMFPGNDSPLLVPALAGNTLVVGILGVIGFILVSSMVADIVEDSQVSTGRRSEGLLLTADSVPQRLITSFSTVVPGLLLTFVGFPERARPGEVPVEILERLAWIYMPIVLVISLLSVATWSFFRIDESKHAANLAATTN